MPDIANVILKYYPEVQAVYLFGRFGTSLERPDSYLALIFPPSQTQSQRYKSQACGPCREELECLTGRSVDLISLRETNTVFQNEIITDGWLIYLPDESGKDAFEMNAMTACQKLNEEHAGILEEIESSGKVLK